MSNELHLEISAASRKGIGRNLAPHDRWWWPWVLRRTANGAVLEHDIAWRDHLASLIEGKASHCVCAGLVMAACMNGDGVIEQRCPVHHHSSQETS